MSKKNYPILKDCLVRGSYGDFYLQKYKDDTDYHLEPREAKILWQCNGQNTIQDLQNIFLINQNDIINFLNVLKKAKLLTFSRKKKDLDFPKLAKSPHLQDIQLEITGQCNLWCKHCYGRKDFLKASKDELTLKEIYNTIDQMERLNVARCFLSGGEIFLRKDLPQIIKYIVKKRINLSGIFTNGTIFRQDIMDMLKKIKTKPTFLVSLDGPNSQINDFLRGKGSYNKTISFIRKVKRLGFRVTINTIVIKKNVKQLNKMRNLLERLGVDRWRISVPREQGETVANKEMIIPAWNDIFLAYKELLLYVLNNKPKMKIQLSSIFKTEFFENGEYFLYQNNSGCCEYKRFSLVLTANGNIIPCPASINFSLGNIRKISLRKIWYSKIAQSFKTLPISKTKCRSCNIRKYCGSGCRVIAWKQTKNYFEKDKNACPLYKFFYKEIKPIFEQYNIKPTLLEKSPEYDGNVRTLKKFISCNN